MDWRFDGLTALVSIAAGKAANLVVLAGNRAKNITDVERVWLLDPDELLPAVRLLLKDLIRKVRDNQIENGREYVVGEPA